MTDLFVQPSQFVFQLLYMLKGYTALSRLTVLEQIFFKFAVAILRRSFALPPPLGPFLPALCMRTSRRAGDENA